MVLAIMLISHNYNFSNFGWLIFFLLFFSGILSIGEAFTKSKKVYVFLRGVSLVSLILVAILIVNGIIISQTTKMLSSP